MSLAKLNHEEILLLSKKLQELNELHQQVIAKETKASQDDWKNLDMAIRQAVLKYRFISEQQSDVCANREPAVNKHIVTRFEYLKNNWQAILIGVAIALLFNLVINMIGDIIVKIALIVNGV